MKKVLKNIVIGLTTISCIAAANPVTASAGTWRSASGSWYYNESGANKTGWQSINGNWYYFDQYGRMKTGWLSDGGNWYYLKSDGTMARNTTVDGYKLNASGAWAANEYYSYTPQVLSNVLHISPKHVYYKDGNLVMEAYVYNGFSHPVYNIRNVSLKVSNGSQMIANAGFEPLAGLVIPANSYKVWTFTFQSKYVNTQNADLSYLDVVSSVNNSF